MVIVHSETSINIFKFEAFVLVELIRALIEKTESGNNNRAIRIMKRIASVFSWDKFAASYMNVTLPWCGRVPDRLKDIVFGFVLCLRAWAQLFLLLQEVLRCLSGAFQLFI